jgi:hypothetical protein
LLRATVAYLRGRDRADAAYVQGSFAFDRPVYGVSDLDIVAVVAQDAAERRIRERWTRLCRLIPWLPRLVYATVYTERQLADAASASVLMHGLGQSDHAGEVLPLFSGGPDLRRKLSLRLRPGLYGPTADWRLVAGPDRRPRDLRRDREDELVAAWLELQFWWQHALLACSRQPGPWPHHAYLCVKLVAEPARTWLWLANGELVQSRREALQRAIRALPEEEAILRLALALHDSLARSPAPPLARALEGLIALTARIARLIAGELERYGTTDVVLGGAGAELLVSTETVEGMRALSSLGSDCRVVPLVDWRARVVPSQPDQAVALIAAGAGDPDTIGAAARLERPGLAPALLAGDLLILPAAATRRPLAAATLRGVQFAGSDPVSFALAAGRPRAAFPELRGWSAADSALRAVAEHGAWISAKPADRTEEPLGVLFGAARAALHLESLASGEQVLPLTVASIADQLRERVPAQSVLVDEAQASFRELRLRGLPVPAGIAAAFERLVCSLDPYAAPGRPPVSRA